MALSFDSVIDWRNLVLARAGTQDYSWAERQANMFAGCVLVPSQALMTEFNKHTEELRETFERAKGLTSDIETVFELCYDDLCDTIAPAFGVTFHVIQRRLYHENLKGQFAHMLLGKDAATLSGLWFRPP